MADLPLENLQELFSAVMERRPVGMVASDWLVRGVLQALRRDESIEVALGLSQRGRATLRRRLQTLNRDAALEGALQSVGLDETLSDWQRCTRLAPLVAHFMAREWKTLRALANPLNDWPQWKRHVFLAARCEVGMPETAGGLRALVQRNGAYRVNKSSWTVLSSFL